MADHPNAIALDKGAQLTSESVEVARIWITNGAGSNVLIDAGILEDPTVFGYLLADTIRHAARAAIRLRSQGISAFLPGWW